MGREEVYIHAQRDATTKVRNHASERVDRNKVVSVGGAALTEISRNRVDNVGQNLTINVGGGTVAPIVRHALAGDRYGVKQAAYFLGDMESLATDSGNFGLNAAGTIAQSADQSLLLTATEDYHLSVGGNATVIVGENFSTSVTRESTEIVGTVKTIEAHETLRLRCGKAELVMHASGEVTFNGKTLSIEFDNQVSAKSARIDLN
jgi:type VI secretion system secreted protein VgrG